MKFHTPPYIEPWRMFLCDNIRAELKNLVHWTNYFGSFPLISLSNISDNDGVFCVSALWIVWKKRPDWTERQFVDYREGACSSDSGKTCDTFLFKNNYLAPECKEGITFHFKAPKSHLSNNSFWPCGFKMRSIKSQRTQISIWTIKFFSSLRQLGQIGTKEALVELNFQLRGTMTSLITKIIGLLFHSKQIVHKIAANSHSYWREKVSYSKQKVVDIENRGKKLTSPISRGGRRRSSSAFLSRRPFGYYRLSSNQLNDYVNFNVIGFAFILYEFMMVTI